MLGLFIVVTYVEQRLIVLPNTAGKKELYGSNPCYLYLFNNEIYNDEKMEYLKKYCLIIKKLNLIYFLIIYELPS